MEHMLLDYQYGIHPVSATEAWVAAGWRTCTGSANQRWLISNLQGKPASIISGFDGNKSRCLSHAPLCFVAPEYRAQLKNSSTVSHCLDATPYTPWAKVPAGIDNYTQVMASRTDIYGLQQVPA